MPPFRQSRRTSCSLTFGYRDENIHKLSDNICTALQLANCWQDIAVDLAKNRIYIPQDEMRRFRVTEGDLHAKICNRAFQTLLKYCMERTAALFNNGLPLCTQVGRDLKLEMRLTWLGGTAILRKISAIDCDVFRRRPSLGMFDAAGLLARAVIPIDLGPVHVNENRRPNSSQISKSSNSNFVSSFFFLPPENAPRSRLSMPIAASPTILWTWLGKNPALSKRLPKSGTAQRNRKIVPRTTRTSSARRTQTHCARI